MIRNKAGRGIVPFFMVCLLMTSVLVAACAPVMAGSTVSEVSEDGVEVAEVFGWNEFVALGFTAFIILVIIAIFVVALFGGNEEYGGMAKASAAVLVIVGVAIWGGAFVISEDAAPPGALVAKPEFGVTVNPANNTTHSTLGVDAYTWDVTWDISDASILPGMDQLTLNFTVFRDDRLQGFYYTNAYVDETSINTHTQDSGLSGTLIAISSGEWQIDWIDSAGNAIANRLEIPSMPQSEATRETVECAITLGDSGIAGMVDEQQTIDSFSITIAAETTDSNGLPIAYSNPTTVLVSVVVTAQA